MGIKKLKIGTITDIEYQGDNEYLVSIKVDLESQLEYCYLNTEERDQYKIGDRIKLEGYWYIENIIKLDR